MGHSPDTHLRHYGRWTAEADLIKSFGALPRGEAPAPSSHGRSSEPTYPPR
jgi:hypothetical protein